MLKIDWALGYANSPRIIVEDTLDLLPREECEFEFRNGIWWHIQSNGLVRYFAHSGANQNEGGFGGAVFEIIHEGKRRSIKGPWSSRASYLNTILPEDQQVADITLYNGKRHPIHTGILLSELIKRWNLNAYLLRARSRYQNGEHGPITASMATNCILKPDNTRYDPSYDYEIFAEPIE